MNFETHKLPDHLGHANTGARLTSVSQREDFRSPTRPGRSRGSARAALPPINRWKIRFFRAYTRRYLRRHFNAVRISSFPRLAADRPAVVYLNHASWWDPLLSLFLAERLFPARPVFGPIEARQLERYGIFRGLGFFGVEPGTIRGGLKFVRTSEVILSDPARMLWLTPQGRFADPRERPATFREGLGQLALRARHAVFVPLAIEYPFWQERLPEALVRFGAPVSAGELPPAIEGGKAQSSCLAKRLERTQEELAIEARSQEPARFDTLLGGKAGVGGIYDSWRRLKSFWGGVAFQAEHRTEHGL
jgi:1-acyl-sn-glycerol-3-phosphate acyltransferase